MNTLLVNKIGDISVGKNIKLINVLHVPRFIYNLISIAKLTCDLNFLVHYQSNSCVIQDQASKRMIGLGNLHKGEVNGAIFTTTYRDTTILCHSTIGYLSYQALRYILQLVNCKFYFNNVAYCDICHKSKQCKHLFKQSINKAKKPFDLIHCDFWG